MTFADGFWFTLGAIAAVIPFLTALFLFVVALQLYDAWMDRLFMKRLKVWRDDPVLSQDPHNQPLRGFRFRRRNLEGW